MCEFKSFDIVECINDKPVLKQTKTMPEKGRLYRVESVRPAADGCSVRLLELTPDCHVGGACACGNCGWDSGRFRRVTSTGNALAVFHAMLDRSKRRHTPIAEPVN